MKIILISLVSLFFVLNAYAFDPSLFINNKEFESRVITPYSKSLANEWVNSQGGRNFALLEAKSILANSLLELKQRENLCDLGMVRILKENGSRNGSVNTSEDLIAALSFLRIENEIDDLFYENLLNSVNLEDEIKNVEDKGVPKFNPLKKKFKSSELDLQETFKEFSSWPDDISKCSVSAYYRLSISFAWKNIKERNKILKRINYSALKEEIISPEIYHKLEVIRESEALDLPVHLTNYIEIVTNAKDKLSPTGRPVHDPAVFSTKYADRKKKLTHRERLYKNFNSTQIMILAGIIEVTAKRIDSKNVSINFQYTESPETSETYVLSPMEKYRLSLRMLKKNMAETMRSDTFSGKTIEYEDLVTAAYETGYIKAEELELILKFEEFWNPKNPKWKVYANFAFSLVGTAAWYLPPPWNVVGALGLVVTQTKIVNEKNKKPNPDDNWNVIL